MPSGPNASGSLIDRFGGVYLLPLAMMIVALPLVGSFSSWATLTVAGLAMGMMIFMMASGLSLVFGLMDVLNFGHSAFITFGAFIAASVLAALAAWVQADSLVLNFLALSAAIGAAANMVLKKPLGQLAAKTYHVSGPWKQPKVEVVTRSQAQAAPAPARQD